MDEVHFNDDIPQILSALSNNPTLLLLSGTNSDSQKQTRAAAFDGMIQEIEFSVHKLS